MHTFNVIRFEDYFANRVKQLTFTFPEDSATSNGAPFWSAPKRFPHPLQFSDGDLGHLHFVMAASILRAETFGIPIPDWAKNPRKLADDVNQVIVPDFQPKKGVKIETDEKATNLSTASIDDAAVINDLIMKLEECQKKLPQGFRMKPIQFEKVCFFSLRKRVFSFSQAGTCVFPACLVSCRFIGDTLNCRARRSIMNLIGCACHLAVPLFFLMFYNFGMNVLIK